MSQVTVWNDGQPIVVKARDTSTDAVRAALVRSLGDTDRALEFVARSGADVLLAALFEDASLSVHHLERFERSAELKATQAVGTVAAYFEAGHSGNSIFMRGLEPLVTDDSDELSHRYMSKGARLMPQLHDAFYQCWVPHD